MSSRKLSSFRCTYCKSCQSAKTFRGRPFLTFDWSKC